MPKLLVTYGNSDNIKVHDEPQHVTLTYKVLKVQKSAIQQWPLIVQHHNFLNDYIGIYKWVWIVSAFLSIMHLKCILNPQCPLRLESHYWHSNYNMLHYKTSMFKIWITSTVQSYLFNTTLANTYAFI